MPRSATRIGGTPTGRWPRRALPARGQAVVEFALILPVMLLLFAAVLDLGRIAFAQVAITNAAREGAFQASITPGSYAAGLPCPLDGSSNLVICRTILETRGSSITIAPGDIDLVCVPANCSVGIGNSVTVRVRTHFSLLTPVLTTFFGGSSDVILSASSVAQIETLPTPSLAPPWATPSPTPSGSASPSPSPTSDACVQPSAGFNVNANPNSYKAPVMLTVIDTSTDGGCAITLWTWNWGDGTSSFESNPLPHPYSVAGNYEVTLTVSNNVGSNTTGAIVIRVKP